MAGLFRKKTAPTTGEPAATAGDSEPSATFSDMVNELSATVSVEAAVGPNMLYATQSRTESIASQLSRRPSHGEAVRGANSSISFAPMEQGDRKADRVPGGVSDMAVTPSLPRIESEKTLLVYTDNGADGSCDGSTETKLGPVDSKDAKSDTDTVTAADDPEKDVAQLSDDTARPAETGEEDALPMLSKPRRILLGCAMMLNVFIGSLSGNAVILTVPSVAVDLGLPELDAQWVVSAFSLAYGCGLLFAGRLADIYGRKPMFLGGLAIASVLSLVTGAVHNASALFVLRALSGLGQAIALPAGFGIVGVTFREEPERTIAFGMFSLGNPVGASVGMVVGGAIAGISKRGWQYLYFILGGATLIVLIVGIIVVPADKREEVKDKRVDWLGGFLVTAALCLFIFSLTDSGNAPKGWKTPYIPALFCLSIVLFVLFGLWEYYVEHHLTLQPVAKLSLLTRNGAKVSIVLLCSFCAFFSVAGCMFCITLLFQNVRHWSPLSNGLHNLPAALAGTVAAFSVMWVVPRFPAPWILMAGAFLTGIATLLFAVEPRGTNYWKCEFIALLLFPFGADLTAGVGSILISNLCDDDEQSVAGALLQTSVQVACALGICITSLVAENIGRKTGDPETGIKHAFYMVTAFVFAVVPIVAIFLRGVGLAKNVQGGSKKKAVAEGVETEVKSGGEEK